MIYNWTNNPEENRVQAEEARAYEMESIQRVSPDAAGCWIDGHIGHYLSAEIILTAAAYGWKDERAINAAMKYWGGLDGDENLAEYVYDAADDAIEWLNANVAPEGYAFDYEDGEFYMMPLEWFGGEDTYEPSFDPQWFVD